MVLRGSARRGLEKRLSAILRPAEYSFRPEETTLGALHAVPLRQDLSSLFDPRPACVVLPSSIEMARETLKALGDAGVAVTIRGGATDPAGGSLITAGEALLLTRRLTEPLELDTDARTLQVSAGIEIERLERLLNAEGLSLGVLPRSRTAKTLGGFLSGPALGEGSLACGSLHARVLSIRLLTPDGEDTEIAAGDPNIPLEEILGGEGQFGLIASVRIRVEPLGRPPIMRWLKLQRETDFPALVFHLLSGETPPRSLLMFSGSHGIDADSPVVGVTSSATFPTDLSVSAVELKPAFSPDIRMAHGKARGSAFSRLILPGELTATLAGMTREGDPLLRAALEAIGPDRFLTWLTIPCPAGDSEELAAHRRMFELRDELIQHGAQPCGFGFWQQGELIDARGEFQLRALKALKARFDPANLINRGRTLELRTRHGAVAEASILKPGAVRVKGLFGGRR